MGEEAGAVRGEDELAAQIRIDTSVIRHGHAPKTGAGDLIGLQEGAPNRLPEIDRVQGQVGLADSQSIGGYDQVVQGDRGGCKRQYEVGVHAAEPQKFLDGRARRIVA